MRKIKILLSLVMIVALSFSMMTFKAFANEATLYGKNDAEVSLSTATHIINSSGKKESVMNENHYIRKGVSEMALFEVTLPTLEEGQTLRDVNLYYKISVNYSVQFFKAGSAAANWTKFADAATIMNDYDTYGIKDCVTRTEDGWYIADVTAYANELALAKEPKMYIALTVPSGTVSLNLGSSGAYTRPYTNAILHTPNGAEASSVKIAQYQAPTYIESTITTNTYAVSPSGKEQVYNENRPMRWDQKYFILWEVDLSSLTANQSFEYCGLSFMISINYGPLIYKAGADAANWKNSADGAHIIDDYNTYGIKDCLTGAPNPQWYTADVTAYANELLAAGERKMYLALCVPSGGSVLQLGFSLTGYTRPYTTANVKTTPDINYNELTSLNEVKAGTSYVAMSDVKNDLSKDGDVIILIAQYKNAAGYSELVSLTPFEAKTIAAKTDSEIVSTIPVQVNSEATHIKAFIWGAADADPLATSVSAEVAAAE